MPTNMDAKQSPTEQKEEGPLTSDDDDDDYDDEATESEVDSQDSWTGESDDDDEEEEEQIREFYAKQEKDELAAMREYYEGEKAGLLRQAKALRAEHRTQLQAQER